MKTKFIPALALMLLAGSSAWAHDDWSLQNNGWNGGGHSSWNNGWNSQSNGPHNRGGHSAHDRHQRYDKTAQYPGTITYYYQNSRAPVVIYETPRVVYRDRVIYRDVPVYQAQAYGYPQPSPQYHYDNGSSLAGTAIGAIAGGALGSQFGRGNGRTASTAIGAVIGGALGGEFIGR